MAFIIIGHAMPWQIIEAKNLIVNFKNRILFDAKLFRDKSCKKW